jgi:hypothetical protein
MRPGLQPSEDKSRFGEGFFNAHRILLLFRLGLIGGQFA